MNTKAPAAFNRAVQEISRLPGIGEKTAERLAFHLLGQPSSAITPLIQALSELHADTRECRICHNLTSEELCNICRHPDRNSKQVCIVEMPQDLYKLEECCDYRGQYHILGGRYAPLDGVFPEDLNIDTLMRRVKSETVEEVILAMSPNTEGEATCELLRQKLSSCPLKLTRLATGLPFGAEIEWSGRGALQDALHFRREVTFS